jgi:ethanolamine utilization protein EutA
VSGSTNLIVAPERLPLRNFPVLLCRFGDPSNAAAVAHTVRAALRRADFTDGAQPLALAFAWDRDPLHADLHALASGICQALPQTLRSPTGLILLIDGDVGMTLGRILTTEVAPGARAISVDSVQLNEFDYVDIGAVAQPANVVPIVIKSLVF